MVESRTLLIYVPIQIPKTIHKKNLLIYLFIPNISRKQLENFTHNFGVQIRSKVKLTNWCTKNRSLCLFSLSMAVVVLVSIWGQKVSVAGIEPAALRKC